MRLNIYQLAAVEIEINDKLIIKQNSFFSVPMYEYTRKPLLVISLEIYRQPHKMLTHCDI